MTPQQLRNSILQQAIEGKLVEQRPNEGTAEELYAQIQEEKRKLITEGKIKKGKPLPEISEDESSFDIPESWKWVRLSQLSKKITDGTHNSPPNGKHGEFLYITAKNIKNDGVNLTDVTYVSSNIHKEIYQRCNPEKGDILFIKDGATTGIVTLNNLDCEFSLLSSVAVIKSFISNKYLVYAIRSDLFQKNIKKQMKGTGITRVTLKILENFVLPLPPLAEQKRIVAKIEELLPFVDKYEKAYNALEEYNARFPEDMKKSILQQAIEGKLVEQRTEEGTAEELYAQIQEEKKKLIAEGKIKKEKPLPEITEEEIPFDIPESWKWVRLGAISYFQGGYAFKSNCYVTKSTNQVIRLGNIKNNKIVSAKTDVWISDDLASKVSSYQIFNEDILITMTGTKGKKDYFYSVLVNDNDLKERMLFLNQRVGCFRTLFIDNSYLLLVLQNEVIRNIIFKYETGTANQGNLGSEDIKKYVYIPLPPLAEQKRIIAKIEELLPYCDKLK